jgi:hypothetical protein
VVPRGGGAVRLPALVAHRCVLDLLFLVIGCSVAA